MAASALPRTDGASVTSPAPRAPRRPRGGVRRRVLGGLLIGLVASGLGACSGDDGGTGAAGSTTVPGAASTIATVGPPSDMSTTTTAYVVPEIAAETVAEICAGTTQIVEADDKIGTLLEPVLAADASDAADAALISALAQVKPFIDDAQAGYDRLAAVLPGELATDAATVRDATLTFYGAVTASSSMEVLMATLGEATQFTDAAKESAARLDATTRATCDQSIYNRN